MRHDYGVLSFTDVIVKSSNVGAIKIGLKLGAERMGLYIRRFGFGRPSSPDFPGESPGIVWDAVEAERQRAGVGVDGLPGRRDAAADGRGGERDRQRRHVVRAARRPRGRQGHAAHDRARRRSVRRAILPETAATLTDIMEQVVTDGTAKSARLVSYTVAGKTGTADKLVNGRYSPSQQNVSFVGFVPSRNPVLTVIVMIDSPRVGGDTGGAIAAPIFKRIADASLRHLGVDADDQSGAAGDRRAHAADSGHAGVADRDAGRGRPCPRARRGDRRCPICAA